MFAEVAQRGPIRKRAFGEGPRCVRDEDLTTRAGRGDSRRAIDVDADIVVPAGDAATTVESHPHPNGDTGWPSLNDEGPLRVDGSRDRSRCVAKDDEERVTLGAALDSAVLAECRPQQRVVALEDLPVGVRVELLGQARGTLDVGEQESDSTCREIAPPLGHGLLLCPAALRVA